jgi:hypothetical protein
MGFLLLGVDSFVACVAIGGIVQRRARVPLAALFGVADGIGFIIGAAIGLNISDATSTVVQTVLLLALGIYLIVIAAGARHFTARWPVWVLPWALTVDNLTYGLTGSHSAASILGQAGEQALSSGLMALVGLLVGVAIPRAFPRVGRTPVAATQFAGAALIVVAGIELLAG